MLSGGERTRLAVARMLLRPSNTLLLDEPTNHLDLDSKEVLLDALVDYGGTLIFVSHDRYFVERLATKIIEVGHGHGGRLSGHLQGVPVAQGACRAAGAGRRAVRRRESRQPPGGSTPAEHGRAGAARPAGRRPCRRPRRPAAHRGQPPITKRERRNAPTPRRAKRDGRRRARRASRRSKARIAEPRAAIRELEATMAAPGFYDDRAAAQPVIDRHQALMWQVGDLMHQWEELQRLPRTRSPTRIADRPAT